MKIKKFFFTIVFILVFTTISFSQLEVADIERSTFLFTGTLTDKDGKSKSYNKSFLVAPAFKYVEQNGAEALSGSYNHLVNYNINFTSSLKTDDRIIKRRISRSNSNDIINNYLKGSSPNELKLRLSTAGRVVLKGEANAKIVLKVQMGNRKLGFKHVSASYIFRLKTDDSSKVQIFDKNNVLVSTVPNGGIFSFKYDDTSFRTFVGQNEAVFTTNTLVETRPLSDMESYAYLSAESSYNLLKKY